MQFSRFVTAARRRVVLSVAVLSVATSGMVLAAKPSVPPITVSNITIDQSSLQAGQALKVTYTLSHPASDKGVLVEFVSETTVKKTVTFAAGTPEAAAGTHTAVVDTTGIANGAYTVRVTVPNGLTSAYVNVTDTSKAELHFYNPRGVDVNRIAGSPAFGRIYVSEGGAGEVAGRTTVEGVYALNPDLTPAFPEAKATSDALFAGGGYDPWASSANSPFRVVVGPDGTVYITDWSDPHSGLFQADPNLDTVTAVLFHPGGTHDQPVSNNNTGGQMYGSMGSVWVEVAGGNRTLYTVDEDLTPGNSVWKYSVPVGASDVNAEPTLFIEASKGPLTDSYEDLVRDAQGNTYVVSNAANEAFKFDASGNKVAQLPNSSLGYYGIAIDDARDRIAIASTSGHILLTNKAFSSVTDMVVGSGTHRDVAFDADGWLYAVNSNDEQLYVLAGPGTPVTGGAASATQTLTVASPLPGDIAPVGAGGLFVGPNGQRYGDGKVDIRDAAYSLRVAAGLNTIP